MDQLNDVVAYIEQVMPLWAAACTAVAGILLLVVLYLEYAPRPAGAPPVHRPGSIPLISSFAKFAGDPVGCVVDGFKECKSLFTIKVFGQNMTFMVGPTAHGPFFNEKDDRVDQNSVYSFMTPVFGPNVVYDAPLPVREQQMNLMADVLSTRSLESYVPQIVDEAQKFFKERWAAKEGNVEFLTSVADLIILTASRCLMGKEIHTQMHSQVAKLFTDIDAGITPLSFFWPTAPTAAHAKRDRARQGMVELFSKVINKRRSTGEKHGDVLDKFIDARYRGGVQYSPEEITGLMTALLFAGQHTSSVTTTWALINILYNPEILAKVMEEQRRLLGEDLSGDLTTSKLDQMTYLNACVLETTRLHPPLIFLMRKALADIDVEVLGTKYVIPKGDIMVACPAAGQRLPEGKYSPFKRPLSFEPERFMAPREEQNDKRFKLSYIGFGHGTHKCRGMKFGELQVKTIISTVLRQFEMSYTSDKLPEACYESLVVPPKKEQTVVHYKRREPAGAAATAKGAEPSTS